MRHLPDAVFSESEYASSQNETQWGEALRMQILLQEVLQKGPDARAFHDSHQDWRRLRLSCCRLQ